MIERFGIFADPKFYDSERQQFTEAGLAYVRGYLEASSKGLDEDLEAIERSRHVSRKCLEFEFTV